MNRRQFLVTPIVLIPFATVATEAALDALPQNEFIDMPGGRELFNEIVGKLRARMLNVDDFVPLGSPGVVFKAPHDELAQVYRGGAAYEIKDLAVFEEENFDVMGWLNATASFRSIVADRAVDYVERKANSLEKVNVCMWPGSVSVDQDYDIIQHSRVLVVSVIFAL